MTTSIQKIGVLGAGQMGSGIAQTAAQYGFHILLADQNREYADQSKLKIGAQFKNWSKKAE